MKKENKKLDGIFTALANQHRRNIVCVLSLGPASISKLAKKEKLSLPAIHKHIKVLEDACLVQRKKSGRCNFLALNRESLTVLREWIGQYHTYWGHDEESLENYVDRIEQES